MIQPPVQPPLSFRIVLTLSSRLRIDSVLLEALKKQKRSLELRNISRHALKKLFKERRIQIKGQSAIPSSELAVGTTYVDVLGFQENSPELDNVENESDIVDDESFEE